MAEAVLVSALVQTLIGNLNTAVLRGVGLLWGSKDDLRRLASEFTTIQLVLQDAEVKQRKDPLLQKWLLDLQDVAYDADDVLDLIATKRLRRRFNSERGKHGHLTSFFSKRNPLLFRVEIALKVKDIRGRLNDIADERKKFELSRVVINNQVGVVESRQTSSTVEKESEIFGRDEEREMLVQKLLHDMGDQDDLSVCAVWGMGGIGKTTLTQLVYNDGRVEKHFELRIWVCVSEDFSLQRLVRAILESVQGGGCSVTELDPLLRLLQEKLRGKKFLLVLDDVWNENTSLWDSLKKELGCGSKGSGVMVTTRNENIARMMATAQIMSHRIGYLSYADSLSLFKRRAFAGREEDKSLVGIGEEIVKKCGGVPLAIKALGSLMRFKTHESEWLAVKESEIWNLPDHGNDIFPVLMLSYDNLSPPMRQCFSYCCIFPKDYWMDRDQLIQLWMANGFLHEEGQKDLYLIGQSIFEELVRRSFLQDVEKHQIGKMSCKMHDIMHDLAESVMRQETHILVDDNVQKIPPRVRHLYCDIRSLEKIKEKRDKLQLQRVDTLHSLINMDRYVDIGRGEFLVPFLSNQRHLRVLDMGIAWTKELPKVVHKWEHLRFLSMSCSELTTLPESITRLHNLQTLKLTCTEELRKLPEGLKYMENLWFVEMESHDRLVCTPPGIGKLTSLQRLSVFIVGEDSAHQISQLKELNLGGELSIRGLENVRNREDVKAANMITKRNLASLNLYWTSGANKISMEHFEATLEDIQPHHNLERICISSYQGSRFPNWMSALTNLSEIILVGCEKCEHLPPLGKLPALKVLKLVELDSIRRLGGEWCGDGKSSFVALTELVLRGMPNLEEWIVPNSHESFLSLQNLEIEECPKLIRLPFLPSLKILDIDKTNPAILGSMMATSIELLRLSGDDDEISLLPGGLVSAQKNLKELKIDDCPDLRSLSIMLDDLYALKKLYFSECDKLEHPPEGLKFLNSLEELEFSFCDSLRLFPAAILEDMPSLRSLKFSDCKKVDLLSGPLQRVVSSLHELVIDSCPELKCLPESIQQFSALRTLRIQFCSGLCSLPEWIGNLRSLSSFGILCCLKLTSLPDGFRNLKSLSMLVICDCSPILLKRCEKSKGEDWPKISHIPRIIWNAEELWRNQRVRRRAFE